MRKQIHGLKEVMSQVKQTYLEKHILYTRKIRLKLIRLYLNTFYANREERELRVVFISKRLKVKQEMWLNVNPIS